MQFHRLIAGLLILGLWSGEPVAWGQSKPSGRSYSSGSSSSSRSSSTPKSSSSVSGKSYSSGSSSGSRATPSSPKPSSSPSGKSYSSGSSPVWKPATPPSSPPAGSRPTPPRPAQPSTSYSSGGTFSASGGGRSTNSGFDSAAAAAQQKQASRNTFTSKAPPSAPNWKPVNPSTESPPTSGTNPFPKGKSYAAPAPPPANVPDTGRGYSSGSASTNTGPKGKSYSSGGPITGRPVTAPTTAPVIDTAAAEAQRKVESRRVFVQSQEPKPTYSPPQGPPVAIDPRDETIRTLRRELDRERWANREARQRDIFRPYAQREVVVYRDPYASFFWWWLLDRSLDQRARWVYHHRLAMDEARYQALLRRDSQLESRLRELEAQGLKRDPTYVPDGLDPDLMYSNDFVDAVYNPTLVDTSAEGTRAASSQPSSGKALRIMLIICAVLGVASFGVWLVFFKRWGR